MRLYIAGPMTGIADYNFPAFFAAEDVLLAQGYDVVNPARMDQEIDGFVPSTDAAKAMAHYMRRDITALLEVDGLFLLPDWSTSKGARMEVAVGLALDLRFLTTVGHFVRPIDSAHVKRLLAHTRYEGPANMLKAVERFIA